ncbi:LRR receptor-like serine/threonine-protein kinase [Populus alba x Populus x berolinensis]|nr:LRR receptor-like serine/threonine-protein kinase [Populus alba x Populus x berolinensis]
MRSRFGVHHSIILLFSIIGFVNGGGNETDQEALLEFKTKITSDPLGIMNLWNASVQFCQWYGVKCSPKHQRVTVLDLNSQFLQGSTSPHLGSLSFLQVLHLYNNSFSSEIPPDLGRLRRLKMLRLHNNLLSGEIPPNISSCLNLISIALGRNNLIGRIPLEFSSLLNLQLLNVEFNNLTGGIPSFFGNYSSLQVLSTTVNNFGGTLPDTLGQLKNLYYISMSENFLTGTIPSSLYNLSFMSILCFPLNQLQGTLPSDLGNKFPYLVELNVGGNQFTGSIPISLSNSSYLARLTIAINGFIGNVPSLEKMHNLWWLSISTNHLGTGGARDLDFLSTVSNATSLQLMAINSNNFGGMLPSAITNFTSLSIMTLDYNRIFGSIPAGLGNLVNLEMLYMGNNQFTGDIPEEIGELQQLKELDLHGNKFSDGVFRNASAVSVVGNSKLCGGIAEFQLLECNFKVTKKGRLTLAMKLVIAASALLCAALVLTSLFLLFVKRKKVEPTPTSSENSVFQISYRRLLKATNGFSLTNLLGVGGFGSVYKGILDNDEKLVAVKVLNLLNPRASKSFKAECEVLRNVRHRNLVKLLTACSGSDYQRNDFKALVYEFMVNGSLEEWLHPKARESSRSLNFVQRLNIAIDISCALEYLHRGCRTPVVHCDLKPSNVLLDDEMTGHVGDFGLARFFPEATNNLSFNQSSTNGVRGTIGYTAPEYGMGNEVSTSGDVFSYGILLLEMFSGKRPTDEIFEDSLNLHTYMKAALPGKVEEILDPILVQEIKGETSSYMWKSQVQDCVVSVLEVGIACSAELPSERMDISEVTAELQAIKEELLRSEEMGTHEVQVVLQS